MHDAVKRTTREHWEHVHKATGQPFDSSLFEWKGFVYDTESATRAVVAVRQNSIDHALDLLIRLHVAFYVHNRDVTDEAVLTELASESALGTSLFLQAYRSQEARQETWQDFAISQKAGISGFPSLIAESGGEAEYSIVTFGHQPAERIVPALEQWLEIIRTAQQVSSALSDDRMMVGHLLATPNNDAVRTDRKQ